MNKIDGFPMIAKLNEQLNLTFNKDSKEKEFTESLEYIYKSLNDSNYNPNHFLNQEEIKKQHTSKYMVLNVVNRFNILNTLLSLFPDDLFKAFLTNNNLRKQLITRGAVVKVENGELISYPYKRYSFPTNESNKENGIDEAKKISLGKATDSEAQEGNCILDWPGCSVVLPEKYNVFTIVNPEINHPFFYVKNTEKNKMISLFETNWGVTILQSDEELVSVGENGEDPKPHKALQSSFTNSSKDNNTDFFSLSVILDNQLLEEKESKLILELPLSTPRQDILMKISDEKGTEAPIFFTFCS
jgi:hypothetical protein